MQGCDVFPITYHLPLLTQLFLQVDNTHPSYPPPAPPPSALAFVIKVEAVVLTTPQGLVLSSLQN